MTVDLLPEFPGNTGYASPIFSWGSWGSLKSWGYKLPLTQNRVILETTMSRPRFEIVQEDMGGWLRVFLGRGEPVGEVARFLSHTLTSWFRERPHLRLRFAVPITRDGDTVELHAWYDQLIFPDVSPMAGPAGGAK